MSGYDFKIQIERDRITCDYSTPEAEELTLPEAAAQREPYLETVELLELWLKNWHRIPTLTAKRLLVERTYNTLGTHLWHLALDNDIGRRIIQCLKQIRDLPDDIRPSFQVRISVKDGGAELADLPWEFLRYPGNELPPFFLSSEANIVLGRWVGDADLNRIRSADGVVRVLFVMSLPDHYPFEDERQRFAKMLRGLGPMTSSLGRSLQIVPPIDHWEPSAVEQALRKAKDQRAPIDIVHLIAVCRGDGSGGSELVLGDGAGRSRKQGPQAVTDALTRSGTTLPSLVVLHLNDYPQDTDPVSEHFERLAPTFIRAGIPAVLAMQYPMTDATDVAFLINFYRKLTAGIAIGTAVQEARRELTLKGPPARHFGAPVLYLQSATDGFLLDTTRRVDPEPALRDERSARDQQKPLNGILENLRVWQGRASPDLTISLLVESWLDAKPWPEPTAEGWNLAWQAIKGRCREVFDDADQRAVYEQLMRDVLNHRREAFP